MAVSSKPLGPVLLAGAALLLCAPQAPAQGDGSRTDNPDLLRGSYSPFCEPAMLCHYGAGGGGAVDLLPQAPAAVAQPAPAPLAAPLPSAPSAAAPLVSLPSAPVAAPAMAMPVAVPYPPVSGSAWDLAYGVTLRGSYVTGGGGDRFEMLATPAAQFHYRGGRTQAEIGVEATLVQPTDGTGRLGAADLTATVRHALDEATALSGAAALRLVQDDAGGLTVGPGGVMTAPLEFRGEADVALSHRFGRASAEVSAGLARFVSGDTQLAGGGTLSNAERNHTRYEAGLRLGYAFTPIVGGFVAGDLGREDFDTPSIALGATRSGWTYGARLGLEANWQDIATLEASVGSGWRSFDAAGLADTRSWLYGVALGYTPNATTQLRAAFDTALAAGSGAAAGGVDYTLSLEAAYRVNPWLGLRASGEATWEERPAPVGATRRYSAGLGADILLGPHSDMVLDYAYGWRDDPQAAVPLRQEHRLSAGVSLQY